MFGPCIPLPLSLFYINLQSEEKQNNELQEKAQDNKAYMTDLGDGVEVTKL